MGRLIQKRSPLVAFTAENGVSSTARPTENYHYDVSGRMIASDVYTDSVNFNRVRRDLLAGTGHGGSEAMVTAEYHGDGGVFRTYYDVFGDARILRNELNHDEVRFYDAMGRLTQQNHRGGLLVDYYAYDLLGQRIRHSNSLLGPGNVEVADYDLQGRVTRQVNFGGDTVSTSYTWNGAISTTGMGNFGGWNKVVSRTGIGGTTIQMDAHGRDLSKSDAGGHVTYFSYDMAGRLVAQSTGGQSQSTSYFNTGRTWQIVDNAGTGNQITATFGYDSGGYRTNESYAGTVWAFNYVAGHSSAYQLLQNATIDYDPLGRITAFTDRDSNNAIKVSYGNEYDLAGNLRHTVSTFPNIAHPQHASPPVHEWYTYDSMNRMTLARGQLSAGGVIERGYTGVALTYDVAGRRRSATQLVALQGPGEIWVEEPSTGGGGHTLPTPDDPEPGGDWVDAMVGYMGDRREDYEYRANGYLMNVYFADEGSSYHGNGYTDRNGVIAAPMLRGTNARDAMGRVSFYQEFDSDGTTIVFNRTAIVYNAASQMTSESQYQRRIEGSAPHSYETTTANSYDGPGGALSHSSTVNKRDGSDSAAADTSTTYSYAIWDDARVSGTSFDNGQGATHNSTYHYDGAGRLASVAIADGRARTISFASNPNGQVLSRIRAKRAAWPLPH